MVFGDVPRLEILGAKMRREPIAVQRHSSITKIIRGMYQVPSLCHLDVTSPAFN